MPAKLRTLGRMHQGKNTLFLSPPEFQYLAKITIRPDGTLVTVGWDGDPEAISQADIFAIAPGKHGSVRKFKIHMPSYVVLVDLAFSPHGDRIAWVLMQTHPSPASALLHRILPMVKLVPKTVTGLWVSQIDGSNLHEIGHLDNPSGPNKIPPIDYVRWLPDGKKLSFVYRDALYTVPAD